MDPEHRSSVGSDSIDPIRVLLVDDDRDFVELASTLLETESEPIETVTEMEPRVALEEIDLDEIDCIVSDYRMPDMDGIEFLEAIRERDPDLPFIMFTGRGSEDVAKRAISAGVSDYIVKDGSPKQYAISANRIENLVLQYRSQRLAARKQRIDTLAQSIARTLLDGSLREEIEQGLCNQLVDSSLYTFAWIGAPETNREEILPRTWAGAGEELLDDVSFARFEPTDNDPNRPAEPDTRRESSIEARALTTGELQVERELSKEPPGNRDPDTWRSAVLRQGFEAAIALPIVYEDVPYGVLGLYTDRPEGITADESAVLSTLVDLAAFAIAASERRRTDTDRRVVEIEFDVADTSLPFVRLASEFDAVVRLERTVHGTGDRRITYYTVEGVQRETLDDVADRIDVEEIELVDHDGSDAVGLTTIGSEPWWATVTDVYGANVRSATADREGGSLVVELPPSADVRRFVEHVRDRYPSIEPIARRERQRPDRTVDRLQGELAERLTDRQREVLETAYHAGYFDWPRTTTSEEIASTLGITQPTFAEHFWAAQRQIAELLLSREE